MEEIPGHEWQGEFHAAEEKDKAEMGEVEDGVGIRSYDGFMDRLGSGSLFCWASSSRRALASTGAFCAYNFAVRLEEAIAIGVTIRLWFIIGHPVFGYWEGFGEAEVEVDCLRDDED